MSQRCGRALVWGLMLWIGIGTGAVHSAKRFPIFDSPGGQIQPMVVPAGGDGFLVLGFEKSRLAARRVEAKGGAPVELFPRVLLPLNEWGRWLAVAPDRRYERFLAVSTCHIGNLCGRILDRFGRRLGPRFVVSRKAPIGAAAVRAQVTYDWVRKRWLVMWTNDGNWSGKSHGFQVLNEDGGPLGPPRKLPGGESFGYDPPSDTLLVTWNDFDRETSGPEVVAQFLSSSGRKLTRKRVLGEESSPPIVHWSDRSRRWLVAWSCRGNDVCGRFFGDSEAISRFRLKMEDGVGISVYFTSIGHAPSHDRYLVSWRANHGWDSKIERDSDEIFAQWIGPDGTTPGRRIRVSHRRGFVPADNGEFTACSPDRPLCLVVWNGARKPGRYGNARHVLGRFLALPAEPE